MDFDNTNGAWPYSNLMQASDGKLYGMTALGGSNGVGVIFSFDPSSSTYTKLQDFNGINGAKPNFGSAFIEVANSEGNCTIPAVSIAIISGTNPACAGQLINFSATPVNGGSFPAYQWKVDGNNVGTDSPTYSSPTLTNGQVVSCVMTSNLPNANPLTANSNSITMTVNAVVIPTITIAQTSCAGDSVVFSSSITNGGTAPSYFWSFNGAGTPANITDSNFILNTTSNGTQVLCRLTSNDGCANPSQITSLPLTINCIAPNANDSEEFKILPNPNSGSFAVRIRLNTQRRVQYTLFTTLGQLLYQSPIYQIYGTQTNQINVSRLADAVYFLKAEIGNRIITKKVIVIRN